eukprot:364403-Chlamydomonas_euryale.AAC.5
MLPSPISFTRQDDAESLGPTSCTGEGKGQMSGCMSFGSCGRVWQGARPRPHAPQGGSCRFGRVHTSSCPNAQVHKQGNVWIAHPLRASTPLPRSPLPQPQPQPQSPHA